MDGGYESGSGVTNANGGLTIGGSDNASYDEYLDGRTLNNSGAATLAINPSYGGALHFLDGATSNNLAGASFAFAADASIVNNGGTPYGGTFINKGTLSKTGGMATSTIGIALDALGGAITVKTGTVSLTGGGELGGTFSLTGPLSLDYGSFTVDSGMSESGTGTVGLTNATATVNGNATLSNFAQSGGSLTGAGALTVSGLTTWTGGSESGSGVTNAKGGLTIGGSDNAYYDEYLDGRTLNNSGAATLAINPSYGSALHFLDGATFNNLAGASFSFTADASIVDNGGTPDGGTFINKGTLSKTGGTGTSTIGIVLDALGGSVAVNAGTTISLTGGGELGGTFSVAGLLSLDNGNFTLNSGLSESGTGTVGLTNATATVNGSSTLSNFAQSGGNLTGTGTLTVSGLTTWTGGYESGAA